MQSPTRNLDETDRTVLLTVLVIGDVVRAEMRSLVEWIEERILTSSKTIFAQTIPAALDRLEPGEFPDLVIVLQSWSNEYSAADLGRLLAFAPLARFVVCYGDWCESDGRNQNIWPLSVRSSIASAHARIERECRLIQGGGDCPPLPWSASREEVFAADHGQISIWNDAQQVLVDSPDLAFQQFLTELMVAIGHSIVPNSPSIVLFDADPWGPIRLQRLQVIQDLHPEVPVTALIDHYQPMLASELQQHGITSIVFKLGFRTIMPRFP